MAWHHSYRFSNITKPGMSWRAILHATHFWRICKPLVNARTPLSSMVHRPAVSRPLSLARTRVCQSTCVTNSLWRLWHTGESPSFCAHSVQYVPGRSCNANMTSCNTCATITVDLILWRQKQCSTHVMQAKWRYAACIGCVPGFVDEDDVVVGAAGFKRLILAVLVAWWLLTLHIIPHCHCNKRLSIHILRSYSDLKLPSHGDRFTCAEFVEWSNSDVSFDSSGSHLVWSSFLHTIPC